MLRSDKAGCYHSSSLLSTIYSISKQTGIEVICYEFSDPQAGKDLTDHKIAPCKKRVRNFVLENNDMERADNMNSGLESPAVLQAPGGQFVKSILPKCQQPLEIMRFQVLLDTITSLLMKMACNIAGIRCWQGYED